MHGFGSESLCGIRVHISQTISNFQNTFSSKLSSLHNIIGSGTAFSSENKSSQNQCRGVLASGILLENDFSPDLSPDPEEQSSGEDLYKTNSWEAGIESALGYQQEEVKPH